MVFLTATSDSLNTRLRSLSWGCWPQIFVPGPCSGLTVIAERCRVDFPHVAQPLEEIPAGNPQLFSAHAHTPTFSHSCTFTHAFPHACTHPHMLRYAYPPHMQADTHMLSHIYTYSHTYAHTCVTCTYLTLTKYTSMKHFISLLTNPQ